MKLIVELSENDYNALKEDGVQNHLALADTIIACGVPYEERPNAEWIYKKFDEDTGIANSCFCSRCGYPPCQVYLDFCAKCGADMRGENNEIL